jgi:predicted ABC-type ATPase
MQQDKPFLIMLAGSNGAGKSTFYKAHLSEISAPFINADVLAKQYNVTSYKAAEMAALLRKQMVNQKQSFITETVLSDPIGAKIEFLKKAEQEGFDVKLIFIGIPSPTFSAQRVARRVHEGGHDVPLEKINTRFERTLLNLQRAVKTLKSVWIYDNSSSDNPYRLILEYKDQVLVYGPIPPIPDWAKRIIA